MEKLDTLHKVALLAATLGFLRALHLDLGEVVFLSGLVLAGFLFRRYFQRR